MSFLKKILKTYVGFTPWRMESIKRVSGLVQATCEISWKKMSSKVCLYVHAQ